MTIWQQITLSFENRIRFDREKQKMTEELQRHVSMDEAMKLILDGYVENEKRKVVK